MLRAAVEASVTDPHADQRGHGVLIVTGLVVVLVSALVALILASRPGSCAEPLRCVYRLGGTGCSPGPCEVARHRAGLQAAGAVITGLVVGGVLIGLSYRPQSSPADQGV